MAGKTLRAVKGFVRERVPPTIWRGMSAAVRAVRPGRTVVQQYGPGDEQDLSVYWDPKMAAILETWGEGNAWNEIQLMLVARTGRVLDIACGTGKTVSLVSRLPGLEVHGCDISDFLIGKAVERGIPRDRLLVTDATAMQFADASFDYAYSIGSLEHFTEDGIFKLLSECRRVVTKTSFHMIPVSRSGKDEGWIKTFQSYHNNSVDWWMSRYRAVYDDVVAIDSVWEDPLSLGKWFVCSR